MVLKSIKDAVRRRITPASQDEPQDSVPAPRGRDGSPGAAGSQDDAFWEAHERLAAMETSQPNEHADLHMVHAFGAPKEWRTMSRVRPDLVHLLAGIHARGMVNGSRFRTILVQDYFLMMRSAEAYGSEQMVRVASARNGAPAGPEPRRSMFSGWFSPREGGR